jgi:hypothetical protein
MDRTMVPLPDDLSELGDELTAAVGRTLDERRHRRRLLARAGTSALSGLLVFVVLAPAGLSPGLQSATPFAADPMSAVLVRPPERPPVRIVRKAPDAGMVLVRPPDRPPLPTVAERRDA